MFSVGIKHAIDKQVDEDVKPIIHGYWIKSHSGYACSNCAALYSSKRLGITKFCPECGAIMDGEVKE